MKCLKIEGGKGYFLTKDEKYSQIDLITKEDLFRFMDMAIKGENIEFDTYDESSLQNEAHKIIYKNLVEKIAEINKQQKQLEDDVNSIFKNELEKYK